MGFAHFWGSGLDTSWFHLGIFLILGGFGLICRASLDCNTGTAGVPLEPESYAPRVLGVTVPPHLGSVRGEAPHKNSWCLGGAKATQCLQQRAAEGRPLGPPQGGGGAKIKKIMWVTHLEYGCGNFITRRCLLGRQNSTAPGPWGPPMGPPGVINHEQIKF